MRTQIYCDSSPSSLLSVVQMAKLFPDCKHFVDMPLRHDAATTLAAWRELVAQTGGNIDPTILADFIKEHFDEPGNELEEHTPEDFVATEEFEYISDVHYREFARAIHAIWPQLCRRVKDVVHQNPEKYSLLAVNNPMIMPGGRFREQYYWDSFWTIKGLISSKMFATTRGMIENLAYLVETYGFIPNGNRIYYLNRSQPPLLTWCVDSYYEATQDLEFVKRVMPSLEKEMKYFTDNKLINQVGWKSHLFQFRVNATGPRPESYREDFEAAEHLVELADKLRLYGDIAAAAESGRDFSARWFDTQGERANTMSSTRTSSILPVELNAIIAGNLNIFSKFYNLMGEPEKSSIALAQFELMREAIHQVFWNETHGCWFDYDVAKQCQIEVFFDTNLFPLFAGCVHDNLDGMRIVNYLQNNGILNYSGIPTSLITSGQQWDFPSGWAPTNWMVIIGLKKVGQPEVAKTLAAKWLAKNYLVWKDSGKMYEKYNVSSDCFKTRGGGGEYELQEGFGWSNGVILDLLKEFSTELVFDTQTHENIRCECCRVQSAPLIITPPQDTIVDQLSLPVEVVAETNIMEQQNALVAALAAELANNTPTAVINDAPALIRAA